MATWSETEGSPQPPGATWLEKEKSYSFSLYSRHATGVTLLLYTARDLVNPVLRVPLNHLIHKSGRIWHCRLPAEKVANACYYAYSVEGPDNLSSECNYFDPDKVLVDPHCKAVFFPPDFRRGASIGRDRMPEGRLSACFPPVRRRLTGASTRGPVTSQIRSFTRCT
jgi:isoamylase